MQEPQRMHGDRPLPPTARLGLGIAALALAMAGTFQYRAAQQAPEPAESLAGQPALPRLAPPPLADFGAEPVSPEARLVANWVVATGDNGAHAFLLVDKKQARVHAFTPAGRLQRSAPALLGATPGDELVPGSEGKEPAHMEPHERITPAGRFVAEPGVNADGEDVLWVDYEAAISLHRVRHAVASERRQQRLASPAIDDNRISFGCINVPVEFFEGVVWPAADAEGAAVVYVLPEEKTVQQVFGVFDVTDPQQLAAARMVRSGAAHPTATTAT